MPSRTSGTATSERSVAMRKSHATASSRPAPIVYPSIAATTGFRQRSAAVSVSPHSSRSAGASVRNSATSPPALNALPPAPRTTTTRTDSSASSPAKIPGNSLRIATVIVFILAWRSIQTVATAPARSTLRNSLMSGSPSRDQENLSLVLPVEHVLHGGARVLQWKRAIDDRLEPPLDHVIEDGLQLENRPEVGAEDPEGFRV